MPLLQKNSVLKCTKRKKSKNAWKYTKKNGKKYERINDWMNEWMILNVMLA